MELDELKAAWQELSARIAARERLDEQMILESIRRRSRDVTERMRGEVAAGVAAGAILACLPVAWALRAGTDTRMLAGAAACLGVAVLNLVVGLRFRRGISDDEPAPNLREALTRKLQRVERYYEWSGRYGPFTGVLFYLSGLYTYLLFRYGRLDLSTTDAVVFGGIACLTGLLLWWGPRRWRRQHTGVLRGCLDDLDAPRAAGGRLERDEVPVFVIVLLLLGVALATLLITWA